MNPGGVRTDLSYSQSEEGRVTYMQLYDVVPFGNDILTLTMWVTSLISWAVHEQL